MKKCQLTLVSILSFAIAVAMCQPVLATTVPFTEDFDSSASDWRDAAGSSVLSYSASGGPDGGAYASGTFNFAASAEGASAVILRAQDEFGSSGGAFEGDWISDGVTNFSAFVRHDALIDLTFFVRFSGPGNWPGAVGINFAPVASNTWTELSFDITASNPQFVTFEGSDFGTVFSNIGHIQIGVKVPSELAGIDTNYSFDVDKAAVVPEPATMAILGLGALLMRRRK